QRAADAVLNVLHFFDEARVDVRHADAEILAAIKGRLLHQLQVFEVCVHEGEVDLLDGQAKHVGIDLLDLPVTDVRVELGVDAVDGQVHRLDGQVEVLVRPRVDGRLVDLDVFRACLDQLLDLAADDRRHVEHRVAPGRVVVVERPLDHRVGAGEHALDRTVGQALPVAPHLDGHRAGPGQPVDDYRPAVVTIAVGADEAAEFHTADRIAARLAGEVGDHVAALHLAVDEHVETDLLLAADPVFGGLAL